MNVINKAALAMLLATVGCGAVPDATSSSEGTASEANTQELSAAEGSTIVEDGTHTGDAAPKPIQPNLLYSQCRVSFFNTCRGYWAHWDGNPVTSAGASSCRRKNGTWTTWSPQYYGTCYTDVANIDGTLLCVGG